MPNFQREQNYLLKKSTRGTRKYDEKRSFAHAIMAFKLCPIRLAPQYFQVKAICKSQSHKEHIDLERIHNKESANNTQSAVQKNKLSLGAFPVQREVRTGRASSRLAGAFTRWCNAQLTTREFTPAAGQACNTLAKRRPFRLQTPGGTRLQVSDSLPQQRFVILSNLTVQNKQLW